MTGSPEAFRQSLCAAFGPMVRIDAAAIGLTLLKAGIFIGLMLFATIGLSWFVWIVGEHRELLSYFLGHELVDTHRQVDHEVEHPVVLGAELVEGQGLAGLQLQDVAGHDLRRRDEDRPALPPDPRTGMGEPAERGGGGLGVADVHLAAVGVKDKAHGGKGGFRS